MISPTLCRHKIIFVESTVAEAVVEKGHKNIILLPIDEEARSNWKKNSNRLNGRRIGLRLTWLRQKL